MDQEITLTFATSRVSLALAPQEFASFRSDTNYSSQDGVLFNKTETSLLIFPSGFSGEYSIPDGVTTVSSGAFEVCRNLSAVSFPQSVTSIENASFKWCDKLSKLVFRGDAPQLGFRPFEYLNAAVVVIINEGALGFGSMFGGFSVQFQPPPPFLVYSIDDAGVSIVHCDTTVTGRVDIPSVINGKPVVEIANDAFRSCTQMTSVSVPSSVKMIGSGAFYNCQSMTNIALPGNLTNIANDLFYLCGSLNV